MTLCANGNSVRYPDSFDVAPSRRNQEIYQQQQYHLKYLQNTSTSA